MGRCGRGVGGCIRFFESRVRRLRWGGGALFRRVYGGRRLLARVVPRIRMLFSVWWAAVWWCTVPVGVFVSFSGREVA